MKILIVGDSQAAGSPGQSLEAALGAAGHSTRRSGHSGKGAYDWTRMYWPEYRSLLRSFRPDQVILVFGSNDAANAHLEDAMRAFQREAAPAEVWYTGPPRYDRRPDVQAKGEPIRAMAVRVFGSKYLDAWTWTGPRVPRSADGLHFTADGGRSWGEGAARAWSSRVSGGGLRRFPAGAWVALAGGVFAAGAYLWSRRG